MVTINKPLSNQDWLYLLEGKMPETVQMEKEINRRIKEAKNEKA